MIPQLFGDSDTPLYGVLHPSARSATPRAAAVFCAPLGHEYLQAHRVIRKLADAVSSRGIPALRFDYTGTGDSSGDADAATLEQMQRDTSQAIDEIRGLTRVRKVVLVALRGGAFAALRSAGETGVVGCVLWEPVMDGAAVVRSLRAEALAGGMELRSLGGFTYGQRLQDDLAAFDPLAHWPAAGCDVRVLANSDERLAALRSRTAQLTWTRTATALDFGPPGTQDLLHVCEAEIDLVADAVQSVAGA